MNNLQVDAGEEEWSKPGDSLLSTKDTDKLQTERGENIPPPLLAPEEETARQHTDSGGFSHNVVMKTAPLPTTGKRNPTYEGAIFPYKGCNPHSDHANTKT